MSRPAVYLGERAAAPQRRIAGRDGAAGFTPLAETDRFAATKGDRDQSPIPADKGREMKTK